MKEQTDGSSEPTAPPEDFFQGGKHRWGPDPCRLVRQVNEFGS
jgi:hypothetical protein